MGKARWLLAAVVLGSTLVTTACAHRCVPADLAQRRDLIDLAGPPGGYPVADGGTVPALAEESRARGAGRLPAGARPYQCLALSGGGLFGAFGVGVLSGWSASGTRPTFDLVTGVSAGALMSTFAFLGPEHDAFLHEQMVGVEPREVFPRVHLLRMIGAGTLFSSDSLAQRIERAITPRILCEVARAHAAGRRLYVATTDLDAHRLVLWDMGAIASRGDADALALYRTVILASAAIPGAFPPILIPIEIDGVRYEELHVDAGVGDRVVFRGQMIAELNRAHGLPGSWAPPGSTLYLINNGKFYSEPRCVRWVLDGLVAAFGGMFSNKSRDELYRVFVNCLQSGVAFQVTGVPQDTSVGRNPLDLSPDEQRQLYAAGYRIGQGTPTGAGWRNDPPGLQPDEQALPRAGTKFQTPR